MPYHIPRMPSMLCSHAAPMRAPCSRAAPMHAVWLGAGHESGEDHVEVYREEAGPDGTMVYVRVDDSQPNAGDNLHGLVCRFSFFLSFFVRAVHHFTCGRAAWVGGRAAWVGRRAAWVGGRAAWVGGRAEWLGSRGGHPQPSLLLGL
jgi:hypothetical protein